MLTTWCEVDKEQWILFLRKMGRSRASTEQLSLRYDTTWRSTENTGTHLHFFTYMYNVQVHRATKPHHSALYLIGSNWDLLRCSRKQRQAPQVPKFSVMLALATSTQDDAAYKIAEYEPPANRTNIQGAPGQTSKRRTCLYTRRLRVYRTAATNNLRDWKTRCRGIYKTLSTTTGALPYEKHRPGVR